MIVWGSFVTKLISKGQRTREFEDTSELHSLPSLMLSANERLSNLSKDDKLHKLQATKSQLPHIFKLLKMRIFHWD